MFDYDLIRRLQHLSMLLSDFDIGEQDNKNANVNKVERLGEGSNS